MILGQPKRCRRIKIPDGIELLAPEQGETFNDYHPGCICLNEFMFKVGVRAPFKYGVAELLNIFGVPSIQWRKCGANRALWKVLLSRKKMMGQVTFAGKKNTKIVSNLPDWGSGR
ncbi:hypothetical protein ACLOJK_033360 [Asimina triloba]